MKLDSLCQLATHAWRAGLLAASALALSGTAALAQTAASAFTDNTPSPTPIFSPSEFRVRLGVAAGPGSPSTSGSGTSGGGSSTTPSGGSGSYPFPVDKNYPGFYVIPPSERVRVLDQGSCGSCVAHAVAVALSSSIAKKYQGAANTFVLSPLVTFVEAGRHCEPNVPNYGWWNDVAFDWIGRNGGSLATPVGPDKYLPVPQKVQVGRHGAFGSGHALPAGMTYIDAMRKYLSTQGAIATGFTVYPTFNHYKQGIYNHDEAVSLLTRLAPAASSGPAKEILDKMVASLKTSVGGHSVAIIGYHTGGSVRMSQLASIFGDTGPEFLRRAIEDAMVIDLPPFWIVQNSYGPDWGIGGIFLVGVRSQLVGGVDSDGAARWISDVTVTLNQQPLPPRPVATTAPSTAPTAIAAASPSGQPAPPAAVQPAPQPVAQAVAGAVVRFRNVFRGDQEIHVETGPVQSSPTQPGWVSAQWVVERVPGSANVRLKNAFRGTFLNTEGGSLAATAIQPGWVSAQWTLEPVPGRADQVRIKNAWTGTYLHTESGALGMGQIQPGWLSAIWTMR